MKIEKLNEKVDWKVAMEGNNSNIDRLRNVATQVNIDPVMGEVVRENEESDKQVGDTFKELSKELDGITPKDPDTGKKITMKPYTEKLALDESLFNDVLDEAVYYPNGEIVPENSVDMDKFLDYNFGTDRNKDNSSFTTEEKQRAVDYWFEKHEPSPYDESLKEKKSSKKKKHLCESSSDGWNEEVLYDVTYILDKLQNINYEISSCVRGAYSNCKTYSELGKYLEELGDSLSNLGEEISEYEEESDDVDEESEIDESMSLKEYVDEDEVEEDDYTVIDLLNDRLFGYGINKSNFRQKWKFAEVEPSVKTSKGTIKRGYFYPTIHADELVTGKPDDRRAFVDNGVGVFVYDEDEASLAKKCAEELKLDFDMKKLVRPVNGFNYIAVVKVPDEIQEMPLKDYVESIGKSMKDFLRGRGEKVKSDFTGSANYSSRKEKEE